MNIESLLAKIELFEECAINSGFKRDLKDFTQSIQQSHNKNLTFLKKLSQKIKDYLIICENNSLDSELDILLKQSKPFTKLNALEQLENLDENGEIPTNSYWTTFNSILNTLTKALGENANEISSLKEVFIQYVHKKEQESTEEQKVLMSLIFKDLKSTSSLREFSKVLNKWDRTLVLYHTLLKSESPKEISLVQIQNGSIDVIFNIDIDISIDLTKIVYTGLQGCAAYLLYKFKGKEMMESFKYNEKLIKLEEQKEKLMLDNIKYSVKELVLEQHKERLKLDPKIDTVSVEKKADEVSKVITEHIIKGNEIKLLNPPKENDEEEIEEKEDPAQDLKAITTIVRERYKKLDEKEKLVLLEKYTIKEKEEKTPHKNKNNQTNK